MPILDEREAAATRNALVEGSLQWSVLDRAVEMGDEINKWRFEEIVWAEVPGAGSATISDHAAVCYERPLVQERATVEGRPVLPKMKEWSAWHHKKFEELTEDVSQRAADECSTDAPRTLEFIDRELFDAAEAVEQQRLARSIRHEGRNSSNGSLTRLWKWRLDALQDIRLCKDRVFHLGWLYHPRNTLRHDAAHLASTGASAEEAWQAMVKRCRRELTFCARVCEAEKKETRRFLDRIAMQSRGGAGSPEEGKGRS